MGKRGFPKRALRRFTLLSSYSKRTEAVLLISLGNQYT